MLVDLLYDVQRDRNTDSSKYYVYASEDMSDIACMLGEVIRSGSSSHVSCLSHHFTLRYKALVYHFTEEQTSIASYHKESGSKSKEGETVDKPPLFDVKTSSLYFILSVGNYRQTTATKRVARTPVLERAIYFW